MPHRIEDVPVHVVLPALYGWNLATNVTARNASGWPAGRIAGEVEPPDVRSIAFQVRGGRVAGSGMRANVVVLNTPQGRRMLELLKDGLGRFEWAPDRSWHTALLWYPPAQDGE